MNPIKKFSVTSSFAAMVVVLIAISSFGLTTSLVNAAGIGESGDMGGDLGGYWGGVEMTPDYYGGVEMAPSYGGVEFAPEYYGGTEFAPYYGGMEFAPYYGGMEFAPESYYGGMEFSPDNYYGGMEFAPYAYETVNVYDTYDVYDTFSSGYNSGAYSFGGGQGFKAPPSYSSGCSTCHYQTPPAPCQTCNQPRPTTPAPCSTCGGSSNVTNISNTSIDNSIRDSFNTNIVNSGNTNITTLAPAVAQPIIQYQFQAPYCVITLTTSGIYSAQATLVWSSTNATTAYISPIGSVAPNGTRAVTGYANQIYSLTVTGQGGTYTCQTQPFTPTYVAPVTPSVSLTQIPYTGLDMGPLGNAMYWGGMLAFAAAATYLLVYFKGGALAFATAAISSNRSKSYNMEHIVVSGNDVEAPVTPVEIEKAPTTNIFNFLPTMSEHMTKDSMTVGRSHTGAPMLIINRA